MTVSDMDVIRKCADAESINKFVECICKQNRDTAFNLAYELMSELQWTKGWKELLDELDLVEG